MAELKNIALEFEIQSEGLRSYPYLLLMRIALIENNEHQAIIELTKSLIIHEYRMIDEVDKILKNLNKSEFSQLVRFLKETKAFIEEVREYNYYDTEIEWIQLHTMSEEELLTYWEIRKEQIRNRPNFENN